MSPRDPARPPSLTDLREPPGLCAGCRHLELLGSRRSVFVFCGASRDRPEMPRYPPLPVVRCAAFERKVGITTQR